MSRVWGGAEAANSWLRGSPSIPAGARGAACAGKDSLWRSRLDLGQPVVMAGSVGCLPDSQAPPLLSHWKSLSPMTEVGTHLPRLPCMYTAEFWTMICKGKSAGVHQGKGSLS